MSFEVSLDELRERRCVFLGDESPATGEPYAIVVALDATDTPRVYRNECMHIAIPLGLFPDSVLDGDTLLCATHGARYRIDDGYCFEGPCIGQTLEEIPFVIDDGIVRVHV